MYSNKVYDEILTTPKEFTKFGEVPCPLFVTFCINVEQALFMINLTLTLTLPEPQPSPNPNPNRTAYYKSMVVGAICARLEEKSKGTVKLYIMTLGTLTPYRGHGVGV